MSMKVLILGINGFVGHRLTETILSKTDWSIVGMDLNSNRLDHCLRYSRLHFQQGDITKEQQWVKSQIENSDTVLPLAAIANPALYGKDPIKMFEIDFEANLNIIKQIHHANKRLVFPSTSEVYGMCDEEELNENTSKLVLGPIENEQWVNSASKQLLERMIYAYGKHEGLNFTVFRPFNWIGPKQDNIFAAEAEYVQVVSKFISDIIHQRNILLVNGGQQKQCFTYIDDGIKALLEIIENKNNSAEGRIFNIGNPENNLSIASLAEKIKTLAMTYPKYHDLAEQTQLVCVNKEEFFGEAYQYMANQIPSIENAQKYLKWHPKTDIDIALRNTLDSYLS